MSGGYFCRHICNCIPFQKSILKRAFQSPIGYCAATKSQTCLKHQHHKSIVFDTHGNKATTAKLMHTMQNVDH